MQQYNEFKRIQLDNERFSTELDSIPLHLSTSSKSLLAQTIQLTSYPNSSNQFFACQPLTILGDESEGSLAVFNLTGSTFFAANLGEAVPPIGMHIITTYVANRWVFRFDG